MKLILSTLIILFALANSSALAANSGMTTLTAQMPSQTIQITDQKFNPIYGEVPYETTCSRQVLDHTIRSCHHESGESCSGGGQVCTTTSDSVCNSHGCTSVPRRSCHQSAGSCHTVSREVCGNENVYRTEHYSCTRTHTVQVGQTLAKTFNHTVEVALSPAAQAAIGTAQLAISVDVNENNVTGELTSSFPDAILNYAVTTVANDNGAVVQNSAEHIQIDLGMSASLVKNMDIATIAKLELGSDAFRFDMVNGAGLEKSLKFAITLIRTPAVWFPTTIYDNSISSSILSLVSAGSTLKAVVPYEKLGLSSIGNNKHSLNLSVSLDAGTVLNASDFRAELDKRLDLNLVKERPSF